MFEPVISLEKQHYYTHWWFITQITDSPSSAHLHVSDWWLKLVFYNEQQKKIRDEVIVLSNVFILQPHTHSHTHAVRSLNLLFVFQLNFLQHHKPTGRNGRENKNIKQLMSNRKKMPRRKQNKIKKKKKKDKSRETLMHCGDCRIQQCCGFSQARLRSSSDRWISLIRGLDLVVFYSLIWALLPV